MVTIDNLLITNNSISYRIQGKKFSVKYPEEHVNIDKNASYIKDVVLSSLMPLATSTNRFILPFKLTEDDKLFWKPIYKIWWEEYHNLKLTCPKITFKTSGKHLENESSCSNEPIILQGLGKESLCTAGILPKHNNVVINFQRRDWVELKKSFDKLGNLGYNTSRIWTNFNSITSLLKSPKNEKIKSHTGIYPFLALPFQSKEILQNSTISENNKVERDNNGVLHFGHSIFQTTPLMNMIGEKHNTSIISLFPSVYEFVPKLILHERFNSLENIQSSCESKTVNVNFCRKCCKCLFNSLFELLNNSPNYSRTFNYDNFNIAINNRCNNTDEVVIMHLLNKLGINTEKSYSRIDRNFSQLNKYIPKKYRKLMLGIYKEHGIKDTQKLPYKWEQKEIDLIDSGVLI